MLAGVIATLISVLLIAISSNILLIIGACAPLGAGSGPIVITYFMGILSNAAFEMLIGIMTAVVNAAFLLPNRKEYRREPLGLMEKRGDCAEGTVHGTDWGVLVGAQAFSQRFMDSISGYVCPELRTRPSDSRPVGGAGTTLGPVVSGLLWDSAGPSAPFIASASVLFLLVLLHPMIWR